MTTFTPKAEALADTFELARMAAEMAGRSAAAGLDPSTYRGIIGAVLALGGRPGTSRGAQPWRTDHEMLTQLVDLTSEVRIRRRQAAELEQQVTDVLDGVGGPSADPRERHLKGARFDCETALEILQRLRTALTYAAERLEAVPGELGETYAELYATVAAGGRLPHDGRFMTGGRLQTYPSGPVPSGPLSVRAEPAARTDAARTEDAGTDPQPPTRTEPAAPAVRDRIRDAYRQLATEPGEFVSITELRTLLPEVSRTELDAALTDLYRKQELNLVPRSNQRFLTNDDWAAAVRCGGEYKHLISIER